MIRPSLPHHQDVSMLTVPGLIVTCRTTAHLHDRTTVRSVFSRIAQPQSCATLQPHNRTTAHLGFRRIVQTPNRTILQPPSRTANQDRCEITRECPCTTAEPHNCTTKTNINQNVKSYHDTQPHNRAFGLSQNCANLELYSPATAQPHSQSRPLRNHTGILLHNRRTAQEQNRTKIYLCNHTTAWLHKCKTTQ